MKKSFLLTISAVSLIASAAMAAEPATSGTAAPSKQKNPEEAFKKMDANSDGSISKDEYMATRGKKDPAKAEKGFTSRDKDGNGSLSKDEFTAKPERKDKSAKASTSGTAAK